MEIEMQTIFEGWKRLSERQRLVLLAVAIELDRPYASCDVMANKLIGWTGLSKKNFNLVVSQLEAKDLVGVARGGFGPNTGKLVSNNFSVRLSGLADALLEILEETTK